MRKRDGISLTVRDPHHDGAREWGYDPDRREFYQRDYRGLGTPAKWTRVRRMSLTADRVLALASLIEGAEDAD